MTAITKPGNLLFVILVLSTMIIVGCKKDPLIPLVTTSEVTGISLTSATTGGEVTEDGGEAVTERGVVWGTSSNPSKGVANATSNGTGIGSFVSVLEELEPGTTYYVRAYATNDVGTGYGLQVSFMTTSVAIPQLTTSAVSEITLNSAISGGNITSDGGSAVTARGICWNTSENPTIENNPTTDETGTGIFVSNLTGLTPGTTYYVRAYATNAVGTAYGNQVMFLTTPPAIPTLTTAVLTNITSVSATSGGNITDDGGNAVTARGICWNTSENPTIENNLTSDETGTGIFESNMTGLTAGTAYYVRAYATNSAGTAYGNQVMFTTSPAMPTLTTAELTNITSVSATSGGNITDDGGDAVTARGVCWSTSVDPTTDDPHTSDATGSGAFTSNLTGLVEETTYYVRAYATTSAGTSYGNQRTFVTPLTPITDIEGNIYNIVKIGDQVWMAENLRSTKFNNDTPIPNVTAPSDWIITFTSAYAWYNNNISNKDPHGTIYNWYVAGSGNICPTGWHVPTEADFGTLEKHLGLTDAEVGTWNWRGTNQGSQLKSTTGWINEGNGTNSTGFTALPSGYRQWVQGDFYGMGELVYFWSSTDDAINGNPTKGYYRHLDASESRIYKGTTEKIGGKYIRCVKD